MSEVKTVRELADKFCSSPVGYDMNHRECYMAGHASRNGEIEMLAKVNFKLNQTVQDYRDEVEQLKAQLKNSCEMNERLSMKLLTAVEFLKEGKAKFAPHTTNSFLDDFIKHLDSDKENTDVK